ncbi:MFS transporter [Betaproteobacteria bacterium]|nr:MFS transporter [Betaproteobacteria bacterium]
MNAAPAPLPAAPPSPPSPVFDFRLAVGLLGILLAAMMAGLNNRVPGLVLADMQGALGLARDDASWLTTAYTAGELATMPFSAWFAVTFSMRRFHLAMLGVALALSVIFPFAQNLPFLLALRFLHGVFSGALIPLLMMAALRFLPPPIRLHGLALFALSVTFSPNVALWLAALCVDRFEDWRWVYWHVVPIGFLAMALVAWGIPGMPPMPERFRQGNWFGMALGFPGLALLALGIDQGVRLDWFHSPLIVAALVTGGVFTTLFFISEWFHPAPFVRLQLLRRRNLGLGFSIFLFLLMTLASGVTLPASALANLHGFRMEQSASLGLLVGLPQLLLGPGVALLLYRKWVDARLVFASGLACIAAACYLSSGITGEWMARQFMTAGILQTIGQPMAVVSALFLGTSVVQPMEGPFVAGLINILRVLGTTLTGAFTGQFTALRGRFHSEMLLDHAGNLLPRLHDPLPGDLGGIVAREASILAVADLYRVFALLALLLIPLVLMLQHIPAPAVKRPPTPTAPMPAGVPS